MMKIHHLIQGTPEWHAFRTGHYGASEAAAMLGLSPHVKRNELLHMKATGTAQEFSAWVQSHILDHGHAVEALARPLVESLIKTELYPVTCSDGVLSASCDGLTIDSTIAFEHKQWNAALAAIVEGGTVPPEHMPQCQQVLLVTGAQKLMFVISDGTPANFVWTWVLPDTAWFMRLTDGWAQFGRDLAAYTPPAPVIATQAALIPALPALHIDVRGEIVMTNLPAFCAAVDNFIAGINLELVFDDDFAHAEANVKCCGEAERELARTKAHALAQTSGLDDLFNTLDYLLKQLSGKRIALEKLIASKKTAIKNEIVFDAHQILAAFIHAAETDFAPLQLAYSAPDFAGALKNKRNRASLIDAADTMLATAKIDIINLAGALRRKLTWLAATVDTAQRSALLPDLQQLIHKPQEDFELAVRARIVAGHVVAPAAAPACDMGAGILAVDDHTIVHHVASHYRSTPHHTATRLQRIDVDAFLHDKNQTAPTGHKEN